MHHILPIAVFLLMVSLGLSLRLTEVVAHWKRMEWSGWGSLVLATFIIPPALALILARVFHLGPAETAGLFMVGAVPGAPLVTRNVRLRSFDPQIAASYQIWAALMVPLLIPILVAAAGTLYGHNIWIPSVLLFKKILFQQFLPLALGMAIVWFAPKGAERMQPKVNVLGNVLFFGLLAVILYKVGPSLKLITPLVPVGALLLGMGAIAAVRLLPFHNPQVRDTFALCNVNRNAGLALLLTTQFIHTPGAPLPTIACYALMAPLLMLLFARYSLRKDAGVAAGRGAAAA